MRPTPRLYWPLLVLLILGFLHALTTWLSQPAVADGWLTILAFLWQASAALLAVLLLLDALSLRQPGTLTVQRQHSENVSLGVWCDVRILIEFQGANRHAREKRMISVFDHYPDACHSRNTQHRDWIHSGTLFTAHYQIKPFERGQQAFGKTDLLLQSRLGFWQRRLQLGKSTQIRVFPNFSAVARYTTMNMEQQTARLGIRMQPMRGQGTEFHQLREFRQGDTLRQIDWNSTARQRKLISRDYQEEKDQRVVFLVDCGRRMRSRDSELSHLDHALNSLLLMSYTALKQGDAVGVLSFGNTTRWLHPVKGVSQMSKLVNSIYDTSTSTQASDYHAAVRYLVSRNLKRSLVVLLTNIRDDNGDDLLQALKLLQQKHLVVIASLEEPEIQTLLESPVQQFDDSLAFAGAVQYQSQRQQTSQRFNHQGILTVNSSPEAMPVALVNRYFEVKREGLL